MAKNRLDYEAHLSRHSHDISAGYTASIAPGMIIPQYFHILGPGDSIYYSSHMFARLQDVVTAFLGEIDIHIDSFFVPLQMLFTPFGQVYSQTDDFISSVFDSSSFATNDSYPLLNLKNTIESAAPSDPDALGFECMGKSFFRLLDAFDLNPLGVCSANMQVQESYQDQQAVDDMLCQNPNIAPWIVSAYQCIYERFYRNDELERLYVRYYNFDNQFSNAVFVDPSKITLRYVQRPKDYFTNTRVSPISSAVNTFVNQNNIFPQDGGSPSSLIEKVDSFLTTGGSTYPFSVIGQRFNDIIGSSNASNAFEHVSNYSLEQKSNVTSAQGMSAANIRALFAVDKFTRIYGRADKTYDDQILAHFGVKIPHDVKHDLTHLKHFRAVLQADPVYATANVQTAQQSTITTLGQVGGQGQVNFNSSQEKFTAPVHGVFMIVAYVVTKPRYVGTFSKLHLLTNRLSFPIVEFDKLGAQPIYAFEASPLYLQGASSAISSRVGWQNRYAQFKEKYNRASWLYFAGQYGHGSVNSNSYGPWVISRLPYGDARIGTVPFSDGLPLIPGSSPTPSRFVMSETLFESPSSLDCVMHRSFEPDWTDLYFNQPHLMLQSDPILTEFMCNAKLVSWMSETGEPDL